MRLTDCFIDLIAYVSYFLKELNTNQPDFDDVRSDIEKLILGCENHLGTGRFSREDYDLARFAVFAWVDESILNSTWKDRTRWLGQQLQNVYYHVFDASEIFFENLNTLKLHQKDIREVYLLCLAMGFKGRYCNQHDEVTLKQLKAFNLAAITGASSGVQPLKTEKLFPDAYNDDDPKNHAPLHKSGIFSSTLFCVTFPILCCIVLFLLFRFILVNAGDNLLRMMP